MAESGKLTPKQACFCEEYTRDYNATAAATRAGYSPNTANEQGARLLVNVSVKDKIQRLEQDRSNRLKLDIDIVVSNLASIAGANIRDYLEIEGEQVKLKNLLNLTPGQLVAIESIKQGRNGIELKLYNKLTASDMLMKHLGGYISASELIEKLPEERLNQLVEELLQKLKK
jgi:phage terminase small subunit